MKHSVVFDGIFKTRTGSQLEGRFTLGLVGGLTFQPKGSRSLFRGWLLSTFAWNRPFTFTIEGSSSQFVGYFFD